MSLKNTCNFGNQRALNMSIHEVDYFTKVKKAIARKRARLLKQSLIDGRIKAVKDCMPFINYLQSINKKLHHAKIDLVIKNAEILVKEQVQKYPEMIVSMSLKLLNNIAEHTDVELTAHKKDAEVIKASQNEIATACSSPRKITITEDNSFIRGSLVLKANKSIIDAHLKTQLNTAKDIITSNI